MGFCIKCEGIGAGRAYLCDRCQNEEKKGTHEKRIAKLEKLVQELLPKETIYVIAENQYHYDKWLIRNKEANKEYKVIFDIDKLRGLKGVTVTVALSPEMKKAFDFINFEAAMGNIKWYDKA